ncbi:MAG TPA: ABC transporter ATP-binding protein [Spirochaetales bacterium]|nr:ABC transporter ATP-binding protein [Spirochaetales bacterium]
MLKEYRTLLPYLKEYRFRYVAGLAFLIAVDAAQLLIPQFIRQTVDLVSSGRFQAGAVASIAARLVLVALFIASGRFLWRYFIHGSSRRIEARLRDRLFAKLMELGPRFHQANKIGDLMARATNDMQSIRMAAGMGFVTLVDGLFMSSAVLVIMFARNPEVAAWTIIPLPPVTALIIVFGTLVGKRFKKVQEIYAKLSELAQETLAGIRVVKSFVKEDAFSERFAEANDRYRKVSMSLVAIFGFFFPFIGFLSGLSTLVLVLAGGNAALANAMSPGDIAAMLVYLEMLVWPLMGAGFMVNMLQRGAASLKRVNEVLDTEPDIAPEPGALELVPGGGIEFRSLSFSYPDAATPALRDVTLALEDGKTLGILGRIGSGKSTLLKLLPRLVDPPPGAVFVGGRDARAYHPDWLRKAFGFVPQDTFLFSDSIRANVLFGAPELDAERFRRVTAVAAIDRDVELFPQGWDTVVGEKGLTLSGGQKQRIAIARALAVDPEILVFDDALSAVDTETEERILAALLEERKGRTNIIVSNRVSTLRHADLVAVLDSGRLAELGTHDELLERDGFYAEIARLQALSAEAPPGSGEPDGAGAPGARETETGGAA